MRVRAAAGLALAACGVSVALAAPSRAPFPVTLRDALGRRVTVRAVPSRIVSLAPAMTEILFALGLDRQIVGVTQYCNYPAAARSKARVGGIVNPSVERVLAQQPQLVLGMRLNPKPVLSALVKAGVPTYAAEPRSVADVMRTIAAIGALTGRRAAAARLVARLESRLRAVESRVRGLPRPSAIMVYQEAPLWVAGAATFPDEAIRLAGGRNAASDIKGYKQYDVEMLLARDPQVIFLTSMDSRNHAARVQAFAERPSMRKLSAVRRGRVFMVNADLVDRAGPRIVAGIEQIAARLHPQALQ